VLSDENSLWRSQDGAQWTQVPKTKPALVLLNADQGVWCGGEEGVELLPLAKI
jgi:hypothetical protein